MIEHILKKGSSLIVSFQVQETGHVRSFYFHTLCRGRGHTGRKYNKGTQGRVSPGHSPAQNGDETICDQKTRISLQILDFFGAILGNFRQFWVLSCTFQDNVLGTHIHTRTAGEPQTSSQNHTNLKSVHSRAVTVTCDTSVGKYSQ